MRIVFEFENHEVRKNQSFFDKLYKLLEKAPVKPEIIEEPEEPKELPEVITKDTPMLDLGLSADWRYKVKLYGEKHCEDDVLRLGQFVSLKNYNGFSSKYSGGYLTCDDINSMVFTLKGVLKKLWTPGMEIPVDALKFNDLTRQTILKNTIGGDVFKDPDFEWDVCYKSKRNLHPFHFLCALIDYIFNPTDEVVSLEERRKAGKDKPEMIYGNLKYDLIRKKFAEIAKNADYRLEMTLEDALFGLSEKPMQIIKNVAIIEHYDNAIHKHVIDREMDFGEFTDKYHSSNGFVKEDGEYYEMRAELIIKLESIIDKLWTDDIGVITIKEMGLESRLKRRYDMYRIEDFRSPQDLHDMYVGASGALSPTRIDTLLRVIHYLMLKK